MSSFSGRRGPNVTRYLQDLNTISPQDTTGDESFDMQENLNFFTNTEFFDLDSGQNTDYQAPPVKPDASTAAPTPAASSTEDPASVMGDISNMDFMNGEFNFSDFNPAYQAPSMNAFADGSHGFQPLQPNHGPVYGNQVHPQHAQFAQSRVAEKRKQQPMEPVSAAPTPRSGNMEENSRVAAEEDKRRRNTAASARFRIKKKQREQALEKSAKEMGDKVSTLESRVSQLETENKWLKNLLVEKNGSKGDVSQMWDEFTKVASSKGAKAKAAKDD